MAPPDALSGSKHQHAAVIEVDPASPCPSNFARAGLALLGVTATTDGGLLCDTFRRSSEGACGDHEAGSSAAGVLALLTVPAAVTPRGCRTHASQPEGNPSYMLFMCYYSSEKFTRLPIAVDMELNLTRPGAASLWSKQAGAAGHAGFNGNYIYACAIATPISHGGYKVRVWEEGSSAP
ncbi:hypothetical protein PHYPSEUDO_002072 [Phytophthora pseudosyringae]|uniref:Uncharacterized protein n=1 Tax=Phytophthora pseudosyringae TaxID=221518 RepID=A0A8T1V5E7_9STRA|nr:hypothetical protein PHYPSEUDO_002072 [Phytophthora pseudosyringae]